MRHQKNGIKTMKRSPPSSFAMPLIEVYVLDGNTITRNDADNRRMKFHFYPQLVQFHFSRLIHLLFALIN